MRRADRVELAGIAVVTALTFWLSPALPNRLSIGGLVLVGASVFLGQGLLRDLWLIFRARRQPASGERRPQQCLCLESGVGVLAILLGLGLVLAGVSNSLALGRTAWTILIGIVLLTGFLLKDFVFGWNPWRLRREKDHLNVIFGWRNR